MNETTIRELDIDSSPAEQESFTALKAGIWPEADTEHFGKDVPKDFYLSKIIRLVYVIDGTMVGYTSAEVDMGVAHIKSTGVLPDYRHRGIAKALKEQMEEKMRQLGCHKIDTEVGVGWASENLNRSMGFTVVARRENHYGGKDFYLMEKSLI